MISSPAVRAAIEQTVEGDPSVRMRGWFRGQGLDLAVYETADARPLVLLTERATGHLEVFYPCERPEPEALDRLAAFVQAVDD